MRTYKGLRVRGVCQVGIFLHGLFQPLPIRLDLAPLSPHGWDWGKANLGSAQLALDLASHVLRSDATALRVYQTLKARLVAEWDCRGFEITAQSLRKFIVQIMEERDRDEEARWRAEHRGNKGRTKPRTSNNFNSSGFRGKKATSRENGHAK